MTVAPFVGGALAAADLLARGAETLAGSNSARAACLLARQALEQVVDDLLEARDFGCPEASMRSRLIALGQAWAEQPDVGYRAATAWWRLSASCHHHAYELDPTPAEAAGAITDVQWLAARVAS